MDENERKMLAFIATMVEKIAVESRCLTGNEIQMLDNIASELGGDELDENEFRY